MTDADLIVIGAGLSGCALIYQLRLHGWKGKIALVEAGRGCGGRSASRRRRDQPDWRLDHGAPGFHLSQPISAELEPLLNGMREAGVLTQDHAEIISIDADGHPTSNGADAMPEGGWWRGNPCMASLCEHLLEQAGSEQLALHWQRRVRWLDFRDDEWTLSDQDRTWQLRSDSLVLSGNLLAHPRSLAMLNWSDVPLRTAVPAGIDSELDLALSQLARCSADIRWNLMMDLELKGATPRQIWLTAEARERWQVERLVLQPQMDGHTGLVVHGLHDGRSITPESQPALLAEQEKRLKTVADQLLREMPKLQMACRQANSLGVMRWGASQPLDHPLQTNLQWCQSSRVGFCGDYVKGSGFGRAQGALESAVRLASRLISA